MKFGRGPKRIVTIVIVIGCAAVLVWYFWEGHRSKTEVDEGPEAPSRVSVQQGERIITLDEATQTRSGIITSPLNPMAYREELQAYGAVLEFQSLADLRKGLLDSRKNLVDSRKNLAATRAQVEKSKASLDASQKEYERLKTLHEDHQNISAKALQAGEAIWRSDKANTDAAEQGLHAAQETLHTAEQSLEVLQDTASQQWGTVIAGWLLEGSPSFERLRQRLDLLIQITLPSGVSIPSAPDSVQVQTGTGKMVFAHLISPSPRTDPRIQGTSFFYAVPAQPGLLQGMNIRAYLPVGQKLQGFFIPSLAVIWWQGRAWVFVQRTSDQFVRREIATERPVQDGWFIVGGFSAKDRIVIKGAELILSEEFRSQLEKEGE